MGQSRKSDRRAHLTKHIEAAVQRAVVEARRRWTARSLERTIAAREACARSLVRGAIRHLIEKGRLEYEYAFGQSYLTISFRRPVAIGERFIILAADYRGRVAPDRRPLIIASGSAFGSGHHPTTRLALLALERAWPFKPGPGNAPAPSVIDIGTGSGILAIAAARLGADRVTALDIDPCARTEAVANIARNALTAAITVTATPLEGLKGPFDVVIANLRLPTLIEMRWWIRDHMAPGGQLVVSGLREEEWAYLETNYQPAGLQFLWQGREGGWCGGLFHREGVDTL